MERIAQINPTGTRGVIREDGVPIHIIVLKNDKSGYELKSVEGLCIPAFLHCPEYGELKIFIHIHYETPSDFYYLVFEVVFGIMQNLKKFHECRAHILTSFDPTVLERIRNDAAEKALALLEDKIPTQYLPQMLQEEFLKKWITSNSAVCKNEALKTVLFSALETTTKTIEPIS